MSTIFEVEDLRLHYKTRFGDVIHAVDGVSYKLKDGEILGIAGESGCGKSTLVAGSMALFMDPLYHTSGDIRIEGKSIIGLDKEDLRKNILGKKISMIPQGALNALNPTRKVKDFATDMMLCHHPEMNKREVHDRLFQRFEKIGLDPKRVLDSYPVELSGGMKQRVVIGVSTLMNPKVVIADEPTSALDVSTQKSVIEMIFNLMDADIVSSMIFITHELPLLKHVSDNIAIMYAGEFVEHGSTDQVLFDPKHPYTKALMDAMMHAEEGAEGHKPVALEGAPPNLKNPPQGCRFADRCPMVKPDCKLNSQYIEEKFERELRCMHV